MSCKVVWDRDFLYNNFEKSFMNKTYKEYREDLILEREIGLFQATQVYVERQIKIENVRYELEVLASEYYSKRNKLVLELTNLENPTSIEKREFVRKCPNNDCNGFLSTALKCGICNCWGCSKCRECKGFTKDECELHVCNQQIVENVKFMEKDAKPCPKCSSMISKVSGCDQMYCIECHTAFSWKTLKIESGVIHNPHFIEYQRTNGKLERNPLDNVRCGREVDNNFMSRYMLKLTQILDRKTVDKVLMICTSLIHIRHVEVRRFRADNRVDANLNLRIELMRNKIDKKSFKQYIQKNEKSNDKKREITQIIDMYLSCTTDLMYRIMEQLNTNTTTINDILDEINKLRLYTNECFNKVGTIYNSKKYKIDEKFNIV